jgi:hypothetical protein
VIDHILLTKKALASRQLLALHLPGGFSHLDSTHFRPCFFGRKPAAFATVAVSWVRAARRSTQACNSFLAVASNSWSNSLYLGKQPAAAEGVLQGGPQADGERHVVVQGSQRYLHLLAAHVLHADAFFSWSFLGTTSISTSLLSQHNSV